MSLRGRASNDVRPGACATTKPERRRKERKRQRLIEGFVFSRRMPTPCPCTIRNMSAGGSKIEVWNDSPELLARGDSVTLYIAGDRKEIDAEVAWRRANAIGLRFTSAVRDPTRPYD